jgi:Heat induced stress protein YflT domain
VQPTSLNDRVVLASFTTYADAQAAVDRLSDAKFPVERTSIVGRDLRLVELVTGRLNYGRAALGGAATGAWFGLLVGLFVAIFAATDTESWFALVLWGVVFGALAGLVFGLASYALTGGRRDFVSISSLVAGQYDVMVDPAVLEDARRVVGLGGQPGAPYTPGNAPAGSYTAQDNAPAPPYTPPNTR